VTSLWLTAGLFQQMVDANVAGLAPLRQLLAGGEALPPAAVAKALAALPGCRLINGYGPTEGTTFTCCQTLTASPVDPGETVPIGRPIANTRVYLLDAALAPVPVGAVGELYAGGDGLARGYHRRPDLTAERFVPDPCGGEPGGRLYRTGDLARYLPDGRIQFLGRGDIQVKIRGFRIEPAEIEAALARHPAVAAAVVALAAAPAMPAGSSPSPAQSDLRLVAYVVPAGAGTTGGGPSETPATLEELRAFLRARLPEPMVPATFVWLAALPLTPNGKLDRRALPAPRWGRGEEEVLAPPRTPGEELLLGLWREVLGVERIGIHDDFFDLGGHSLMATRLVSRVRRSFGVELPLAALFEAPTVAGLATSMARLAGPLAGGDVHPEVSKPITSRPRPESPPLSFAQERLWFLDRLEPDGALYNMPVAARLVGELAMGALAASLGEIVRRHEALRTRFVLSPAGPPVQLAGPWRPLGLPLLDLSALPERRRGAEASRLLEHLAGRSFDLSAGPLLRAALLRSAAREHILLLAMHHIAADGWSMGVLLRELAALYPAAAAGRPSPLPELPIQYVDFALWQREWLSGERLAAEVAAWRAALAGAATALALPIDRPWPPVRSGRGAQRRLALEPALVAAASALCRRCDATPFMLPLLFQVGFGLSPVQAGLLSFSSTLGAMFVRTFSRLLLRFLGFRRTLIGGALLSAAVTAGYALLDADTPAWIIVVAVLLSGCIRSIQYLALNTISYADVPRATLSRSTSVGGVVQQLARGFGVAIGAALLAMVAGSERVTTDDFRVVFLLLALIPLFSAFGFLRLSPDDGAEVSGHKAAAGTAVKAG